MPSLSKDHTQQLVNLAVVAAVLSSLISSSAWILQGEAIKHLSALPVAALQGLLAGIVYLGWLLVSNQKIPLGKALVHRWALFEFVLLRGVLASILLCYALMDTASVKVMFFTKLEPYFILFWAWLLYRATVSRTHLVWLSVHIGGALMLSLAGQQTHPLELRGDLLMLLAVAILSYTYLHAKKLTQELGSVHVNGISSILGGLILLPIAYLVAPPGVWNPFQIGWAYLFGLVISFNVVGLTLWYWSFHHLPEWLVSALRAVGPVLAAPIAWIFFNQTLTDLQILGALVVLYTSAMMARMQRRSA